MAAPILNEKAKEYNVDVVYYANVEDYDFTEYFEKYNFKGVPNVVYLKAGEFKVNSQQYKSNESEHEEYFEDVFEQLFTSND